MPGRPLFASIERKGQKILQLKRVEPRVKKGSKSATKHASPPVPVSTSAPAAAAAASSASSSALAATAGGGLDEGCMHTMHTAAACALHRASCFDSSRRLTDGGLADGGLVI